MVLITFITSHFTNSFDRFKTNAEDDRQNTPVNLSVPETSKSAANKTVPSKSDTLPGTSAGTPEPTTKPKPKSSLRESLAAVGGAQTASSSLSDKLKQDIDNRSEMLKYARELHNEKIKTQRLKQEALELKKLKLQLEINSLQGYQVAIVSTENPEPTDN